MDEDHDRVGALPLRQTKVGPLAAIWTVAEGTPAREEVEQQATAGHSRQAYDGTWENGAAMDFDLPPEHELLRRTVREFAEGEVAPVAEELDRTKAFPYEIVEKLGRLNLMGIPFPLEYGGAGGDTLAYTLAVEELTRVDSSVAITLCAHTSLGTQPVYLFGSEEQKREWLPRLCSGERLGAFGLTEPDAGSDAGNTRTRAQLEDGEWVVNGAKQFITNAGTDISGIVCITAVTGQADANGAKEGATGVEKEISNLIIANGTPGYEQGEPYRKMGWNASDTRPLTFSDCRVPEENLLGPRGAGLRQFLHILDIGRIGVAAMGVGLAQGALEEALRYAKQRIAFGTPISKFQAIQGKLADMSSEIAAARLLVYKAAREKDSKRNFTLTAAQAKLKTGRLAVRCAEEAVQIHGGYGFIEEYPVCRFYRDAKVLTIGEGTDEIQQMVIARALGA
jgi:short/branched chain acyl-CoA dehydrogenase